MPAPHRGCPALSGDWVASWAGRGLCLFASGGCRQGFGGCLCQAPRTPPPPCHAGKEAGGGRVVLDMDFVAGMRAAGAALPGACLHLLPAARGGQAGQRGSGRHAPKFSPSLLFLLLVKAEGWGKCYVGMRWGAMFWGSLVLPLLSLGLIRAGNGQVLAAQVLLAWDLRMLQGLGVVSSPQSCPFCHSSYLRGRRRAGSGVLGPRSQPPHISCSSCSRLSWGWTRPWCVPDPPPLSPQQGRSPGWRERVLPLPRLSSPRCHVCFPKLRPYEQPLD